MASGTCYTYRITRSKDLAGRMVLFGIKDAAHPNKCRTRETEREGREVRRHRSSEGLAVELEPSMAMSVML